MIRGASVISPGAQINVKSDVDQWLDMAIDWNNRRSFTTITNIFNSTTWFGFLCLLLCNDWWRGEKLDEHKSSCVIVFCTCNTRGFYIFNSKLGSSAANPLFVRETLKAAASESCTFDRPVQFVMIEWPFNTPRSSEKCCWSTQHFKHSVETEFLTSHTTWARAITKGQTENKVFFLSCPAVVTGGNTSLLQSRQCIFNKPRRGHCWSGIAAEQARVRRVRGLPEDQQPKFLKSVFHYGDSRMESGIENTVCQ